MGLGVQLVPQNGTSTRRPAGRVARTQPQPDCSLSAFRFAIPVSYWSPRLVEHAPGEIRPIYLSSLYRKPLEKGTGSGASCGRAPWGTESGCRMNNDAYRQTTMGGRETCASGQIMGLSIESFEGGNGGLVNTARCSHTLARGGTSNVIWDEGTSPTENVTQAQ
ncbi:hypothetical protein BDV59DRAFT_132505 [Aspergillus ambiguus]|uniref:uncharacterized protein n=1 Tax=Aspergillus ambiguus TaxID=176160 RepID=UPI003CCD9877